MGINTVAHSSYRGKYLKSNLIWIFENQVLIVSSFCSKSHLCQTDKQKTIITTYQEFLGTCIESKKQYMYSMYQQLQLLQTSCFVTFGSSACQRNLPWYVQLPSQAKSQELLSSLKSHKQIPNKVKNHKRYYFKIKLLSVQP